MPTIARWADLPPNVRQHLLDRMRDRAITISDLNQGRKTLGRKPSRAEFKGVSFKSLYVADVEGFS